MFVNSVFWESTQLMLMIVTVLISYLNNETLFHSNVVMDLFYSLYLNTALLFICMFYVASIYWAESIQLQTLMSLPWQAGFTLNNYFNYN